MPAENFDLVSDPSARLKSIEPGSTTEAALALFNSLPAVSLPEMLGSWRGSGLKTGHAMDGLLEVFGWHGKRFESSEDVHPLIFEKPDGSLFNINPLLIPMGFVARHSSLLKSPAVARILRVLLGCLRTTKPRARLRMTEFRSVVSATMIYDALPVNDVFRKIDSNTLLGAMDMRESTALFFFVLRREGLAAIEQDEENCTRFSGGSS